MVNWLTSRPQTLKRNLFDEYAARYLCGTKSSTMFVIKQRKMRVLSFNKKAFDGWICWRELTILILKKGVWR